MERSTANKGRQNKGRQEERRQDKRRSGRSDPPTTTLDTRASAIDTVGNAALFAILFIAPLIMGGRHPLGKLFYLFLVGAFAVVWLVRQAFADKADYKPNGIGWLFGAAIGLVVLQIAPLPPNIIRTLSPFQSSLLPMWSDTATPIALGTWNRLTLAPFSTREGLVTLLTHITLFTVAVQWLRNWHQVERLMRFVALSTIAMAAFGFIQYLSHTPKFAFVFTHPSRDASRVLCGPFANSNHFSHFLALGIGPVLWWLHTSLTTREQTSNNTTTSFGGNRRSPTEHLHLALIASLALIATCGLLAQSRGGILVLFCASALGVGLFALKGQFGAKSFAAILATGVCVAVALGIHGKDEVASELATMTSIENIDKSECRRRVWRANLQAAKRFSICGSGVGSHDEIYRRFFPHPSEVEYTHAESGFLQVLTETGLPGLGLVLMCIGACGRWLWILFRHASDDQTGVVIAAAVSLSASAIHSVFDFVWFLPACMSLTILVAAATCRMAQLVIEEKALGGCPDTFIAMICKRGFRPILPAASALPLTDQWFPNTLVGQSNDTSTLAPRLPSDPNVAADPDPGPDTGPDPDTAPETGPDTDTAPIPALVDSTGPRPASLLPNAPPSGSTYSRTAWLSFAAALLAMFVGLGRWQLPVAQASLSWNRYLRLSLEKTSPRTITEDANEPPEDRKARTELERARNARKFERMVTELTATLAKFPEHPRANIRMAGFRIRMFEEAQAVGENAMPLDQIRDAAYASLEVAPEKVDRWLTAALGDNRDFIQDAFDNAQTGVMNSPLLGRGYMFLSQLAFLKGQTTDGAAQLVHQAFAVRPYNGNIWLAIGEMAFQEGDVEKAFKFRQRAFHQDEECRLAIINGLAGQMPVTTFLQQFEPDEAGLRMLLRFYLVHHQQNNARVAAGFLGDHAIQRARETNGEASAANWVRATLLYRMSGDDEQTLACAATAAQTAPNSMRVRRTYATELMRQQNWNAAIPELRWCLNRRPSDARIKQMLAIATRTANLHDSPSR